MTDTTTDNNPTGGTAPADVLAEVARWREAGKDAAVATVIQTWGSAPRQAGSMLGISSEGELAGSVSGGCVEGAVLEEALEIMKTGTPKLLTFGVSDDEAWTVGLACGGTIRVFVEKVG
ncbi:XdhC family protein [Futiania mangrovi]|uniref:XdhC family protein n=1 Tax=Futiania mangrovi TaxID=2959716 RepID=A0A9J6P8J8_9PROT|nr:XdhC family protein [Futiania mangrovii]MCP1336044.1 XdhC family protein [Futiania mangrovii]